MFSRISKQSITALLILSFLIPSSLFLYPKKVVAQGVATDCTAVVAGAIGASVVWAKFKEKIGVTSGSSDSEINTVGAGAGFGTFFNDCVLRPLAIRMAKALLNDMTRKTVEWINNGFEGNPGFAVDLGGMLQDTADEVIGDFLANEAPFLCSQFSFELKVALSQSYLPYKKRAACTLTDIVNNVNGFIDSNNEVSWKNWIEVTTQPRNNAYGAFAIAQDELSRRIFDAQEKEKTYLNWGRGFKDWEFCEKDANGVKKCTKETPGAIVEQRLNATLNMDLQQIGLANDINAVYDALTNQLAKQILEKSFGLLGGNSGPRKSVVKPSNYATAAQPINIAPNAIDPLSTAITVGVTTGVDDTSDQFVPPATDVLSGDSGTFGTTTIGRPTGGDTLAVQVNPSSSIFVDEENPFFYEATLNTNYPTFGLNFRIAFKYTGSGADTPYLGVFPDVDVKYTLSNGATLEARVIDPEQATIGWYDVSTDLGAPFSVQLRAEKLIGAPSGSYTLQTVIYDDEGTTLDSKDHTLFVQ